MMSTLLKQIKKGAYRQFSHRLIYELYKICDKVYPLNVVTTENSHVAVMYEAEDGQRYVADLSGEIEYCRDFPNMFNRKNPRLFGVPLDEYIKAKDNPFIRYANETLTNNPKAIHELNFVYLTNHPAGPEPMESDMGSDHIECPRKLRGPKGLARPYDGSYVESPEHMKCGPMESDLESDPIECPGELRETRGD